MSIYFLRHWQTFNNAQGKMNPWDDDDILTDVWETQAYKVWESIKDQKISFDVIISSNLKRAKKTAEIIAVVLWYTQEIVEDKRLREQDGGVFKGKKKQEIMWGYSLQTDEEFRRIFKSKMYNMTEDIIEFDSRVSQAYKDIKVKYTNKNVLIVAHSWTSRALLRAAQDWDFEYFHYQMPWISNCQLIELEHFSLEEESCT